MEDNIKQYIPIIEEEYRRLGLFYNVYAAGIALQVIEFYKESKTFNYHFVEADDHFKRLLNITNIENFKYEQFFPIEGSGKFDWNVVLGHSGVFYSTSYFYCYSEVLSKWFRFLVICPKKNYVLTVVEDITQQIQVNSVPISSNS